MQSNFNLSTRRAPCSRNFSLFSAADPCSPADMTARPSLPRAPSPGGRPPRTCTSAGPTTETPLLPAGRRGATRRRSVIPCGQKALPRPAEGIHERAPHGRRRRARSRSAAIPADLPLSATSNSRTYHARRTERQTAVARRSGESMATKEREAGTSGEGAGARGGRKRRGAAVVPMIAGRAGRRNDARGYLKSAW